MLELPLSTEPGVFEPLACPLCHECNLHQVEISIFRRAAEDGHGDEVRVSAHLFGMAPEISPRRASDLAHRRQSLTIQFECELCAGRPVLRIYQHKGCTLFAWDPPPQLKFTSPRTPVESPSLIDDD